MNRLELMIVLGGISAACVAKWRWAVQCAIIVTIFEGALRKWLLPGYSQYIYFVKDFLLLGAYIGYWLDPDRRPFQLTFQMTLAVIIASGAVLLQALNPNLGSLVLGIFGAKAYLWYVPLFFILPETFRTKEEFFRFTRWLVILTIPLGGLAIWQFQAPIDSAINTYAPGSESVTAFPEGEHPMVTATFSYMGGFTSFLMLTFCLLLPELLSPQKPLNLLWRAAALCLLLGSMFMTGGRKNFAFIGLYCVVVGILSFLSGDVRTGFFKVSVSLAIVSAITLVVFTPAASAFLSRARGAGDFTDRTALHLTLLPELGRANLRGYGAGLYFVTRSDLPTTLNVRAPKFVPEYIDFEPTLVLRELGMLGFLAWYWLRLVILWGLWNTWREVSDPRFKLLAAGACSYHLAHLYLSVYLNHIANVYVWFMAGFILLLPRLDSPGPTVSGSETQKIGWRRGRRPPRSPTDPCTGSTKVRSIGLRRYKRLPERRVSESPPTGGENTKGPRSGTS